MFWILYAVRGNSVLAEEAVIILDKMTLEDAMQAILTPHLLVAGATGSGKTNCQRLLVYDLASQNPPNDLNFILIDTRKRGKWWEDFAHIPHLAHPVIAEPQTALKALMWATSEIDRRAEMGTTKPKTFVCIDEVQSLLSVKDYQVEIGALLKDLTEAGREYGLHCILGLQNPTAEMMGGTADLKRNMVTRLVGKVDGGTAAYAATGQSNTGAEMLTGSGDFLLVDPMGVKRLTAALLTHRDIALLPRTENVPSLDLDPYQDVDYVLEQADVAHRQPDPPEPAHIAYALTDPDMSQRQLCRQFSIGFPKAKRVLAFAAQLRAELAGLGYYICHKPLVQRN